MGDMKEQRHPVPRPSRGNTVTAQGENQAPKAQEPYERDESAASQSADNPSMERIGKIAHDAQAKGQEDTTKGQELDATYQKVRAASTPAPRGKPERGPREG